MLDFTADLFAVVIVALTTKSFYFRCPQVRFDSIWRCTSEYESKYTFYTIFNSQGLHD